MYNFSFSFRVFCDMFGLFWLYGGLERYFLVRNYIGDYYKGVLEFGCKFWNSFIIENRFMGINDNFSC